ncbi:MAG: hypothetical protein GTO45_21250 [Candidatus Aminicenantes bacterium]|nr:hypothetical protein [Candidatus Aminicenantes bacterium]NIM81288.1 hypothetical protein [Candidatus Aminicenantes bacterium]NIN20692.1 hypothetical protein [Candidatus Aminicenantes bacterium]NIN44468.1 hypothetical protein [Candidatus Aminicenantes bacterium]NIN87290.1 hypothetical protein [Candidatus Aminicenantes bacterium]
MLKEPDISTFRLEILRKDRLQELSENFPKADAFKRLYLEAAIYWYGWSRNNKERIKPHLDELNQTLPQYSHLWQMVEIS